MTTRRPWYGSATITSSAVYSCNNSIMHSSCGCTYVRILSLVFCFFILPWPHTVCCILNSCTPLPPLIYPHIHTSPPFVTPPFSLPYSSLFVPSPPPLLLPPSSPVPCASFTWVQASAMLMSALLAMVPIVDSSKATEKHGLTEVSWKAQSLT